VQCPVIPYGKADLLIGLDVLEAARALDGRMNLRVAHPGRTHAVINNHKNETVLSLMGKEDFDPDQLEEFIQTKVCLGGYLSTDFANLSEKHIGSKLYVNMILLGAAYQKGWLPLSESSLIKALKSSVRKSDIDENMRAFRLGRYVVANPALLRGLLKEPTLHELIEEKAGYLSVKNSKIYRKLIDQVFRWILVPKETQYLLATTIYDLIRYGGESMAQEYVALIWKTYQKDNEKFGFRATAAVVEQLYRVMAIKDEVWVAELLTSPEKYARDHDRYKIDAARGDKISYSHYTRPRFDVGPFKFEFDIQTRDWMLKIMRHFKFLRWFLPAWHKREKDFKDWYIQLVKEFRYYENDQGYQTYLKILKSPDEARGFREIRYPLMERAMKKVELWKRELESHQYVKEIKNKYSKSPDGRRSGHPQSS